MSRPCDHLFNQNVENENVAAVSCIHNCMSHVCSGDEKTRKGCCFSSRKKMLPHTVPVVMQTNAKQMETHMPLEITADRMPKLNKNFLKFWRGNHDVTVLDDSGNKMQYATTYVSKCKHTELMDDVLKTVGNRSQDLLPSNMKLYVT